MQETDARSLRAALAAIAEAQKPLDPETIRELNQIAIDLREHPASAISQLRRIMEADGIQAPYDEARQKLLAGYQSQPRGKEIKLPLGKLPEPGENELENLSVPLDQIAVAQQILAATNPSERAREVRANIEKQIAEDGQAPSSRSFWEWVSYFKF